MKIDPESQKALFYCAECYMKKYDYVTASDYYRRAAEKTGELKNNAEKRLNLISRILRANPVSESGKKIMLKENIDRYDLCVLLVEELKIIELLAKNRPDLLKCITTKILPYGINRLKFLLMSVQSRYKNIFSI